jgi:hypothetical protein
MDGSLQMGFDNDHLGTQMPFGAPSTPSFPRKPLEDDIRPERPANRNAGHVNLRSRTPSAT